MAHVVDTELTRLQADVYMAIREAVNDYGMSPTQTEIAAAVGCSLTAVIKAIARLRRKGYIDAPRFVIRGLTPTDPNRTIGVDDDPWGDLVEKRWFKPPA